jgi:homoaconitate hydratase
VAASALSGIISGPGTYQMPADWSGVDYGFGTGLGRTTEHELANALQHMESLIERVESVVDASKPAIEILPGFPERISGEILSCDADNLDTYSIYPGKLTYQDVSKEVMSRACMQNYDPNFDGIAKPNDILVAGCVCVELRLWIIKRTGCNRATSKADSAGRSWEFWEYLRPE